MKDVKSTSVPKRALARLILNCADQDEIREYFHVGVDTELERRLQDFKKSQLIEFLQENPQREAALSSLEREYPLSGSPTLYLVRVTKRPEYNEIIERTQDLADQERAGGKSFDNTRAVRVVYATIPAFRLAHRNHILEIPLSYERRFEYNVGDPQSDLYGQHLVAYSLERGFAWLIEGYDHGVICCGDYVAIRPIIQFFAERLFIRSHLPELNDQMIQRLSAGANPRSVTYSAYQVNDYDGLDVQTVTMSDPSLSERIAYTTVQDSPDRYQTAGFYRNHPSLVFGGIGISRRYGRIWTPAHITRHQLTALSVDLIERTEEELRFERERNPRGYVRYHRHIPVEIRKRRIQGQLRDAFDSLVQLLLQASKNPGQEAELSADLQLDLVGNQRPLALIVTLVGECPSCGQILFRCPDCNTLYLVELQDESIVIRCPTCEITLSEPEELQCECHQAIPIADIRNHITIYPDQPLLYSIDTFMQEMGEPAFRWFFARGLWIKLLSPKPRPAIDRVKLEDLTQWRTAARYHLRSVPMGNRLRTVKSVLNHAREKCPINDYHPRQQDCDQCLDGILELDAVKAGEICLPRIMGYAIGKRFDGIHHGHEIADVKYQDGIEGQNGIRHEARLGIHLKSRTTHRKQGLGRSVKCIKGLYTQLFFSVHQVLIGEVPLDVVGISVPNTIKIDVVESMQSLVNRLGIPFLVMDEDSWLKIVDCVLEELEFDQQANDSQ